LRLPSHRCRRSAQLNDSHLINISHTYVDAILSRQQPDGWVGPRFAAGKFADMSVRISSRVAHLPSGHSNSRRLSHPARTPGTNNTGHHLL
jgi:hypothetical protein